ncbi:sigma-54-dependent Fis family transcriptional regulator [bacterium]|nr:sigma-54-dependent Fis family transcriptional regulator [bacterium]
MMNPKILVVDDELNMQKALSGILHQQGYDVKVCGDGKEAIEILDTEQFNLIITDIKMPRVDGMTMLSTVRKKNKEIPVIIVTGHATVDSAIDAVKLGAYDYIRKPYMPEEILLSARRAIEHEKLVNENLYLHDQLKEKFRLKGLIGNNKKMQDVYQLVQKVSKANASILIRGESGTGKELIANAIHYNSPRKKNKFLAINCGALPENLLESELFGHEKGAFTGAISSRKGIFESADKGTIFLDEIGDLSLITQMKLLRVLQDGEFRGVGGVRQIKVDVRIISATNRDLEDRIKEGLFREDLYYRINVIAIDLPPLRERKDDIALLVKHFLASKRISSEAMNLLINFDWPGNVRELENVIERAVTLQEGACILPKDLPEYISVGAGFAPARIKTIARENFHEARTVFESDFLINTLKKANGNISLASKKAGISRRHFYEKMKIYGIKR